MIYIRLHYTYREFPVNDQLFKMKKKTISKYEYISWTVYIKNSIYLKD